MDKYLCKSLQLFISICWGAGWCVECTIMLLSVCNGD